MVSWLLQGRPQSYSSRYHRPLRAIRHADLCGPGRGVYLPFDDPPYAKNQRVMVPLRNISEALGLHGGVGEEDGRDLAVAPGTA